MRVVRWDTTEARGKCCGRDHGGSGGVLMASVVVWVAALLDGVEHGAFVFEMVARGSSWWHS